LAHQRLDIDQPGISEDMSLWVIDGGERGLAGSLLFNADLLEEATARRIIATYERILAAIARDPQQSLDAATSAPEQVVTAATSPASSAAMLESPDEGVAHGGEQLTYVRTLWERHLGVAVEPGDNFFDLGGSSMLAIRVLADIGRDTGVKLRLPQLAVQTAAEIAGQLPERDVGSANSGWFKRMFGRR
jgi:hypothetical protein